MGVKGLFQFLKRFEKGINIPEYILGKSVGIDVFWFLHQSKGDMFVLQNNLLPILKNAKEVHCVFDGAPSQEKQQILDNQHRKRNEILQSIEQIEKFLKYPFSRLNREDKQFIQQYVNQLKRQAWQPPLEYIDYVKNWLYNKGCKIYQAPQEADTVLIELEQKKVINVIITNDSDLLVLGSSNILRPISPLRGNIIDREVISSILGLTAQQWNNFMYLCKNMKENDILLAYSLISVYKDLEIIIQKYYTLYENDLIQNDIATEEFFLD